ncbi:PAP2-domain-containing protein [Saccharata proteae CBS 121410]|uniref:PAP2-domain-containing protein n=1 Tax=Saccharata proteae CBS 121410 TaxID=1314787 RepID=A0A6A5YA98_9PEZI|nr:PAP2-domain-containing protein [Saccharata proteae CBS 121410]
MRSIELPSKRLIASYVLDWIVIIAIAAVGGAWNSITPYHRPFSLLDLSISFPMTTPETIPTWLLIVVSLIVPAAIVFLVCIFFLPSRGNQSRTTSGVWRRKLWELNVGWMGLALSVATAFLITQGMKNLFGKPRPDLLDRCQPDVANLANYVVGGYGQDISARWALVSSGICKQSDASTLNDGFRSFPSGHSSFSWAGLLYLTLFLCSKFAIAIPFLPPTASPTASTSPSNDHQDPAPLLPLHTPKPTHHSDPTPASSTFTSSTSAPPNLLGSSASPHPSAAHSLPPAPPTLTLILPLIPLGAAAYISASRYFDFRHHGFDIIVGTLIGMVCGWGGFRWFHCPVGRGGGSAWGVRKGWGFGWM